MNECKFESSDIKLYANRENLVIGPLDLSSMLSFFFHAFTSHTSISPDDPMPASYPRETKEEIERRGWEFLIWLCNINRYPTTSYKCDKKIETTTYVVAVSHSAYLRHLFSLIGLFNPNDRALSNLEIRHIEINPEALCAYVAREAPHSVVGSLQPFVYGSTHTWLNLNANPNSSVDPPDVGTPVFGNRIPSIPSNFKYLHITPAFPLNDSVFAKVPDLECRQISISQLEKVLRPAQELLIEQPFSLLIFPPPSTVPLIAETALPVAETQLAQQNREADQNSVISALSSLEALITLGAVVDAPFCTTTFADEVLLGEKEKGMRNRLVEDGRHIIQPVAGDEKWEVICKECVHDQNCVVFLLPVEGEIYLPSVVYRFLFHKTNHTRSQSLIPSLNSVSVINSA